MDGDKPVCYYKEHISKFLDHDAEYHWVQMKPDLCVGQVHDPNKAGMISFKLSVARKNVQINVKETKAWKRQPAPRAQAVIIRAYIYQCRDLPASDDNGSSDPFVRVWDMSGKDKKT